MAQVVHVVAVEIQVAPARHVLDEQAFRPDDRRQAGGGHALVQEGCAVARQQRPAGSVQVLTLPGGALRRGIDVAFALRWRSGHG